MSRAEPWPPPVRMRLKRHVRDWSLQEASRAINGRDGVAVTRPGQFGNPCRVGMFRGYGAAEAVRDHRRWLAGDPSAPFFGDPQPPSRETIRRALAGKNLACSCKLCARHEKTGKPLGEACADCPPCHADTLLEIANANA